MCPKSALSLFLIKWSTGTLSFMVTASRNFQELTVPELFYLRYQDVESLKRSKIYLILMQTAVLRIRFLVMQLNADLDSINI
jgi:hypothetical protein